MGCMTMEMTIIQVTKTPFTRITPDNLLSGRIFVRIHLAFTWHCSIRTSFSHQPVQVFNLLRKCTSTVEQIFVQHGVNSDRDEYLHGSVSNSRLNLCNTLF